MRVAALLGRPPFARGLEYRSTAGRLDLALPGRLGGPSPIKLAEIELGEPLPWLSSERSDGAAPYGRASVLVRLHRRVLGSLELELPDQGLDPDSLAEAVWSRFRVEISAHLAEDGLPPLDRLPAGGLSPREAIPPCGYERDLEQRAAPFVSVVVPTVGRPALLMSCLDALLVMTYPDFEIIVVDNDPADPRTAEALEERMAADSRVRYAAQRRRGISSARNRGLELARGEIVAFTDDDVVVDRHWLAALVRGFAVHDDVACVTGLVLPRELETPAQLWFEQFGGFNKGFQRRVYDLDENRPDDRLYPYAAGVFGTGANMAFRTNVLREFGGFSPWLGAGTSAVGGEDLDAFLALLFAGHRLLYEPDALMRHPARRGFEGLRRQVGDYGTGLSAMIAKQLVEDSDHRWELLRRIPSGLVFALDPRSVKNAKKRRDYPRILTLDELAGMLRGPGAYLRSRLSRR